MHLDRRSAMLGLGATALSGSSLAAFVEPPDYRDPDAMYAALRDQPRVAISGFSSTINVVFADGAAGLMRPQVLDWIRNAVRAVTAYFGRFPVETYGLLVIATPGDSVGHATTFGYAGAATRIHVGVDATRDAFHRDWVLVHEMVHTALPDLPRRALWLQEGNATYIEPIARAMIGELAPDEVWRESIVGMPKGEPADNEPGMDGTQAWGRLYWGGAIFWLLAEVASYRDTKGQGSLRDALRAINQASGGNIVTWSPAKLMAIGDAALGTQTLSGLYTRFATSRIQTDLGALFRELGIAHQADGSVRFDNDAPLARLRRRITSR